MAKSHEKSIIFLDGIMIYLSYYIVSTFNVVIFVIEFDSIAATRVSGEDSIQSRRLLSELLLQLTMLKSRKHILS